MLELSSFLARERGLVWAITGSSLRSGSDLLGRPRRVNLSGGGLWQCDMRDIQLGGDERYDAWLALLDAMDEGATPVIVPYYDHSRSTLVEAGFGDGGTFADGSSFLQGAIEASVITPAALRATTLRIAATQPPRGSFSVVSYTKGVRLHRINMSEEVSSGVYDIAIRPPLRDSVDSDTPLDFDNPRCAMRLADGGIPTLSLRRNATCNASFIEQG